MTQEDKLLLLQDLSARLPYSTLCYCKWTKDAPNGTSGCIQEVSTHLLDELMIIDSLNYECQICEIKPYLRSMDDMTEEERHDYNTIAMHTIVTSKGFVHIEATDLIDWLNARHFDYRGLIERGLALEALEGMYNLK